jgi:hypothetical protein
VLDCFWLLCCFDSDAFSLLIFSNSFLRGFGCAIYTSCLYSIGYLALYSVSLFASYSTSCAKRA